MDFVRVLQESFRLLQKRPVLFLPKLITSTVWGIFWLYMLNGLSRPELLSVQQLQLLSLFLLVMTPIHVWVFNVYVHIVEQHQHGAINMQKSFIDGLSRLPRGLGAVAVTILFIILASLPGGLIAVIGYVNGSITLQIVGGLLFLALGLAVTMIFYLSPAAVLMGEGSFLEDFRYGFSSSKTHIREVGAITLFSFLLLIATVFVEGALETAGIIGFFLGRWLGALISVYLVIINPQMLVNVQGTATPQS